MKLLRNRFVRNAATLQAGAILNGFGGLATVVLLAHFLGARLQGEYYVALAMYSGLALVVNFGLVQVTVNQVATAAAKRNGEKVTEWLGFLAKAYFLLGCLLPVLGWFALPLVERLVVGDGGGGETGADLVRMAWLLTFTPLLEVPKQVVTGALQGTRRMVLLAKTENAAELVRVFTVTAGTLFFFSPLGPVVGMLAASGIGSILSLELYRRARLDDGYPLPPLLEVFRRAPGVNVLVGLPLTLRFGALRNLDTFALEVFPPLLMRTFASPEWVAYFRVANRIMNVPLMFMQGVSRTALPAMSELKGLEDMDRFRRSWTRVTLLGGGIVGGGILLALPLLPFVTAAFFPEDYVDPVFTLALILAVGFVPSAFCVALDTFFLVVDRLGVLIKITAVGMALVIPLSVLVCTFFPDTGPAWSFSIAKCWALVNFLYVAHYFRTHARSGGASPPTAEEAEQPIPVERASGTP